MSMFDLEEDPGWIQSIWDWTSSVWSYWTTPAPDKLPFQPSVLKARIGLCLSRISVIRKQMDQSLADKVRKMALEESKEAETFAFELFKQIQLESTFRLLEPHLQVLNASVNLPNFEESPYQSVRAIIYASSRTTRLPELAQVVQQLVQKYGQNIAILKKDLVDNELVTVIETCHTRIEILEYLDKVAPGKSWGTKLEEERNRILALSRLPDDFLPNSQNKSPIDQDNDTQKQNMNAPAYGADDNDDNDDNNDDDDHHHGGIPNCPDLSGSEGSFPPPSAPPADLLEVTDFRLYPQLKLSLNDGPGRSNPTPSERLEASMTS